MSMELIGRAPTSATGDYFRAPIWEWHPLLQRIEMLCSDLLDEQLITLMGYNDGAGPKRQVTCHLMAERLAQLLIDDRRSTFPLEHDSLAAIASAGRIHILKGLAAHPELSPTSSFGVRRSTVVEFIEFLNSCGGFQVY